jgi:hypothetical protein
MEDDGCIAQTHDCAPDTQRARLQLHRILRDPLWQLA